MLRTLFSDILNDVSLFLGGMLIGVALGIIATLVGVTAYINKEKND
ncbi:membrane protein [Streptomyces phage TunaTartare]|uniref:Membrane protein n=1 Tax=Streptomyces phage TunaTartare TaxID=2848887 RepID=A0A8F2IWE4_9CAUD|nr:membrane protein [Streptomyces phage TunaTartare]QWT29957.1 membrane protein [Streptomyces phage TunaTartare]